MTVMTRASSGAAPETISDKTLIRLQAISGLMFGSFLVLHLSNMATALAGQATYDAFMGVMRWYYQFPLVEIVVVIGSATLHMAVGVMRIRRRRARARADAPPPNWRVRMHRYTAYYIMAAFFGHVIATRLPGLLGHPADFSFLKFSLTVLPGFFYPYYVGLAFSGFYHMTHGTIAALRVLGVRLPKGSTAPRSRFFWAWAALTLVLAVFGILALGGNLFATDDSRFEEWKALYQAVLPEGVDLGL